MSTSKRFDPSALLYAIDRQRDAIARQMQEAPLESRTHALLEGMLVALGWCRLEMTGQLLGTGACPPDLQETPASWHQPATPVVNADRPHGYDPLTGPVTPQEERAWRAHQQLLEIQKNLDVQSRHAAALAAIANLATPLTDDEIQRAEQAQQRDVDRHDQCIHDPERGQP